MPITPGPWKQHDPDYCPFEIWGDLEGPLEDGQIHGQQVCSVIEGDDVLTAYDNARLIVAAPDLLAACEAALKALSPYDGYIGVGADACKQLRAAIAKAK